MGELRSEGADQVERTDPAEGAAVDVDAEYALAEGLDGLDGGGRWAREVECGAYLGKALAFVAIGEQSVVADPGEPGGQHVQQEALEELRGRQRHRLAAVATGAIAVGEANDTFVEAEEALV